MKKKETENFIAEDLESLKKKAFFYIQTFKPKQLVFLKGPLGSGKTQWVKFLLEALGGEDEASSPSFSLLNEYEVGEQKIFHLDLYRIESEEDLETVGLWELFSLEKAWIFIEWPEKYLGSWPSHWPLTEFEFQVIEDSSKRKVLVKNTD